MIGIDLPVGMSVTIVIVTEIDTIDEDDIDWYRSNRRDRLFNISEPKWGEEKEENYGYFHP